VQDAVVTAGRAPLEDVYREHGARLWRALLGYTADPDIASDAMAEAFAQALRGKERIRDPAKWVWRASFRIAAGEMKHRSGYRDMPERTYEGPEPVRDLVEALKTLSPRQRAAVLLHDYAGYPVREVAGIVGSTPPAIRVHLSAGRRRLRERLEEIDD
jgi:RNA polymerase sigma-70 factor (ECF subfamily)